MKRFHLAVAASLVLVAAAPSLSEAQVRPRPAPAAAKPAQPTQPPPLSPADRALVAQATASLQGLTGARGRFIQTDPNGAVSRGNIYMQRPGKLRFEYDPARPLLVVSDGNNVKIYDRALKTFDQYPLGATPLALFLAREVRLDRGVVIERVERRPNVFAIVARDGRKEAEGRIELVFSNAPQVLLQEWTVIDPQGQRTRVQLTGMDRVATLDPKLFVLRDPTQRPGRSGRF